MTTFTCRQPAKWLIYVIQAPIAYPCVPMCIQDLPRCSPFVHTIFSNQYRNRKIRAKKNINETLQLWIRTGLSCCYLFFWLSPGAAGWAISSTCFSRRTLPFFLRHLFKPVSTVNREYETGIGMRTASIDNMHIRFECASIDLRDLLRCCCSSIMVRGTTLLTDQIYSGNLFQV